MAIDNPQHTFVTNFNADGQADGIKLMTDERGHMYPLSRLFTGDVLGANGLKVMANGSSLSVKVLPGYVQVPVDGKDFDYLAWMEGENENDALVIPLATAHNQYPRYSAIVAYIDTAKQYAESVTNNEGLMVIKETIGEPSANPTTLTKDYIRQNDPEIGLKPFVILAQVYIPANAQSITDNNITDTRSLLSLSNGIGLPANSYTAGVRPYSGSIGQDNIQIAVINAGAAIPTSTNSDLLVFRLAA